MSYGCGLSTQEILAILSAEVEARSGTVVDVFDDGCRVFARSVLPRVEEVRPGDKHQGGVALRGTESEVWVHPYMFRQVCRNGAVMARALQTRHVSGLDELPCDEASESIREAIEVCCADEAFTSAIGQTRSATEAEADLVLALLPHLAHFTGRRQGAFLARILDRFHVGSDRSRYGLMNAVTSVARDTRDPELRWRLEELGGGIPAALLPVDDDSGSHAHRQLDVLIG
jgi:hypothetical protein